MQKQREHWSSQLGFILAAAGSAIGLGTLWKVPYVIGENGGGIFVLIYFLSVLFVAIPVFIAELLLGRKAQRGAVGIFASLSNNSAVWKTAGWLGVMASFVLVSFYAVVAGWGLNYVLMSLNQFYLNRTPQETIAIFELLESSGDISLFWFFVFMAMTIGVVYPGVRQGIEFWTKFMTSGLLVIMLVLCSYSITLDGFGDAVHFLFYPDFAKFKPSSALAALALSFFTLSLGQAIMLTYGSYMRRDEDIPKTAGIIGIMIIVVAILAGLMIFPIIFTFGFNTQSGPGLIFKTLPFLFSKLPGALLLSTAFFTLFTFAALTSAVAMIEACVANCMDLYGWSRKKSVLIVGLAAFVFGIPSALAKSDTLFANWTAMYGKSFFDTMNDLLDWLLLAGGLMVSIFTGWVLDEQISKEEFEQGTAFKIFWKPWIFFMKWVAPAAIICVILQIAGILDIDKLFS